MPGNLFTDIPVPLPVELVETLSRSGQVRIERIVSRGHASPPDFWYDQECEEFVLLVSGGARLEFADGQPPVSLAAGDWLIIPARQRHRVAWTDPELDSVWLAVHYR
jgi:cupin 2 domain-containing protein